MFSTFDIVSIFAALAWPAIAVFFAALGLAGISSAVRKRRGWRVGLVVTALVLAVDTVVALPMAAAIVQEQVRSWEIEYYTYRLDAPRRLDGTLFPAGSVVRLSVDPPHRLYAGSVPTPTKILGLDLIGEFAIAFDSDGTAAVGDGTLASEGMVAELPCAPGAFQRLDSHRGACTLARDLPIAGIVLRAGTRAEVWHDPLDGPPLDIEGTLAEPAQLAGLPCAPGPVKDSPYGVRCVLADDWTVNGFPLARGRPIALQLASGKPNVLAEGTFSTPLEIQGVTLPADTRINFIGDYDAETLRTGPLIPQKNASFILPAGRDVAIEGAILNGEMEIEFAANGIAISNWSVNATGGTIVFAGERHSIGFFDKARRRWRFDADIDRPD